MSFVFSGLYYMSTGNDILAGMAFEIADKINVEAAKREMEMEAAAAAAATAKAVEEGNR